MLAALFQLERSQWQSPNELWQSQRRQLLHVLRHAVDTTPFYRERMTGSLRTLRTEFSPQDFAALPIVTRADLQRDFALMRSSDVPAAHGRVSEGATSGSTGMPVRFLATELTSFFWHAFNLRDHLWHERDFSLKMAALRMGGKITIDDNWFGEIGHALMTTGPCVVIPSELAIEAQLDHLAEHEPAYIHGFANNIRELATLAIRKNVRLQGLREARTFGETVTDEHRSLCKRAWSVPLTDIYTTREVGYLALQCPEGEHYHVQSESAVVEIINDSGAPCSPGEWGRVIVTPLHNFAMPLIRYEIGDFAEVGEACPCGRGLPVLKRILGRSRNMLRLPGGETRWPALGTSEFLEIAAIRQFRFVQTSYEELEARLVVERPLTPQEEESLAQTVTSHLDWPFRVRFVYCESLPYGVGGKFEDFICVVQ